MFKYTWAAFCIIWDELKKWAKFFEVAYAIFMAVYFAYIFIMSVGIVYVNVALLAAYTFYTLFKLLVKEKNKAKQKATKFYSFFSLALKAITLASSLYAIYIAGSDVNGIAIIVAILSLVVWTLQALIQIVIFVFEPRIELIVSGIGMDLEPLEKITKWNINIKDEHREFLQKEADKRKGEKKNAKKVAFRAKIEKIKSKILPKTTKQQTQPQDQDQLQTSNK